MNAGEPLRGAEGGSRGLFQGLRGPTQAEETAAPVEDRELFVRRARKDGRPLAVLRAFERGGECVVEAEVFPDPGSTHSVRPGPYSFADAGRASTFVAQTLEALVYLGCEIESAEQPTEEPEDSRARF